MDANEFQDVTIQIPKHMVTKLEEIARERKSSVSEEAVRLIRLSFLKLYPSMTEKEDWDQYWKKERKELIHVWKQIILSFLRRIFGR